MAFRVVWSETALADLRDLVRYIARDDRQVAKRFGDLIVTKVQSLQAFPRIGRIVPEYREECLRELINSLSNRLRNRRWDHLVGDSAHMARRTWEFGTASLTACKFHLLLPFQNGIARVLLNLQVEKRCVPQHGSIFQLPER